MAEAGTVEDDHAVSSRRKIDETARFKIFNLCAISVDKHQRLTAPAIDVMQADPIDVEKLADRRVPLFALGCYGTGRLVAGRWHLRARTTNAPLG